MGVDIHMYLVEKDTGDIVMENIYDGRNSEWFNNLQNSSYDNSEYDYLPIKCDIPDFITNGVIKEDYRSGDYYGFHYMSYTDYLSWFTKYRPDIQAGWFTTYDKWRIENKGYVPIPEDVPHYLDSDMNKDDMHFVEYKNIYCCDKCVIDEIQNRLMDTPYRRHPENLYLVYYFDC